MTAQAIVVSDTQIARRRDRAAAFRPCHRFGWSESLGDPFSAAVADSRRRCLFNLR